jgi:DNA invertase Pin-like site-specific DNA recombinase
MKDQRSYWTIASTITDYRKLDHHRKLFIETASELASFSAIDHKEATHASLLLKAANGILPEPFPFLTSHGE